MAVDRVLPRDRRDKDASADAQTSRQHQSTRLRKLRALSGRLRWGAASSSQSRNCASWVRRRLVLFLVPAVSLHPSHCQRCRPMRSCPFFRIGDWQTGHFFACFERVLMTHIAHETTQADTRAHLPRGDTLLRWGAASSSQSRNCASWVRRRLVLFLVPVVSLHPSHCQRCRPMRSCPVLRIGDWPTGHLVACFERVLMTHIAHETTQADTRAHLPRGDTPTGEKANQTLNQ